MTAKNYAITTVSGEVVDLSDFHEYMECEAKDDAGRHFSGTAEIIYDLRECYEVIQEHRRMYATYVNWDGDWGYERDFLTPVQIIPEEAPEPKVLVNVRVSGAELALSMNHPGFSSVSEIDVNKQYAILIREVPEDA